MIQLTGINRNAIHLAPAAIASVTEAMAANGTASAQSSVRLTARCLRCVIVLMTLCGRSRRRDEERGSIEA